MVSHDEESNHVPKENGQSVSGSKTPTRYESGVPSLETSDSERREIAAVEEQFEQIEREGEGEE